jgi:hypothetical protein
MTARRVAEAVGEAPAALNLRPVAARSRVSRAYAAPLDALDLLALHALTTDRPGARNGVSAPVEAVMAGTILESADLPSDSSEPRSVAWL